MIPESTRPGLKPTLQIISFPFIGHREEDKRQNNLFDVFFWPMEGKIITDHQIFNCIFVEEKEEKDEKIIF